MPPQQSGLSTPFTGQAGFVVSPLLERSTIRSGDAAVAVYDDLADAEEANRTLDDVDFDIPHLSKIARGMNPERQVIGFDGGVPSEPSWSDGRQACSGPASDLAGRLLA